MDEGTTTVYACKTCHIRLAPKICKSDKNGNCGRAYVSCHAKSRDGTHCSYYFWLAEGTDGSPPSSPALSTPSSSPDPSLLAPPSTQPSITLSTTLTICVKRGFGMGRLHIDCPRKMCRQHCLEAGSCRVKTHLSTNLTTGTLLPSTLGAHEQFLSSPPPPSNPPPSVNHVVAGPSTEDSGHSALDFYSNPQHASQIVPAFTQQYAHEQALEEKKRAADEEQLAILRKRSIPSWFMAGQA